MLTLISADIFGTFQCMYFNLVSFIEGRIYPSVCVASWMGYINEFEAGTIARLGILPKDAFGNNVTSSSTSEDLSFLNFTLSALYPNNGSIAGLLNITSIGWNGLGGYISVDFIVVKAGNFFLLVQGQNQTLIGNPLAFKVNPGDASQKLLIVENLVQRHYFRDADSNFFFKVI